MKGIFYLLVSYLLGEALSRVIGGFMPGSVLGMVVLFAALKTGVVKADDIKGVATMLLDNMILFFVPIGVGLIATYKVIGPNMLVIVATLVVTTLLVIAVVGWMQQKTGGKRHV